MDLLMHPKNFAYAEESLRGFSRKQSKSILTAVKWYVDYFKECEEKRQEEVTTKQANLTPISACEVSSCALPYDLVSKIYNNSYSKGEHKNKELDIEIAGGIVLRLAWHSYNLEEMNIVIDTAYKALESR
jgi:hypothetical protein